MKEYNKCIVVQHVSLPLFYIKVKEQSCKKKAPEKFAIIYIYNCILNTDIYS
jgi:hypothetical protein